ncbi:hypothetical protein GCM10025857_23520 [Alicyclobacillus contaminans]|nr:hypothetical protein GCM10025857_23520 [Alicyclobacillus contaminans]
MGFSHHLHAKVTQLDGNRWGWHPHRNDLGLAYRPILLQNVLAQAALELLAGATDENLYSAKGFQYNTLM